MASDAFIRPFDLDLLCPAALSRRPVFFFAGPLDDDDL